MAISPWHYQSQGRDYATANAGRTVMCHPLSLGTAFRVIVVGAYYESVLVSPLDDRDVPEGMTGLLDPVSQYPTGCYVCLVVGSVMTVPVSALKDIEAKDNRYPHWCPKCFAPAYLGVVPASLDCSRGCK